LSKQAWRPVQHRYFQGRIKGALTTCSGLTSKGKAKPRAKSEDFRETPIFGKMPTFLKDL